MSGLPEYPERLAVIGLGYVGLPLACAFSHHLPTIGFDSDRDRVRELSDGVDRNGEVSGEALVGPQLEFTVDVGRLSECDFFVIAVPTPVNDDKRPDLSYLVAASEMVGSVLRARSNGPGGDGPTPIIVYESTVFPGATEQVCVPSIERTSGLVAGTDFRVGYSPERTNFGDPEHALEAVVKVVSGQDEESARLIARTYSLVVRAGVHTAPNIRTAEAAKVIENVQRDLNIALMNELTILFREMGIDTADVLAAARTKWNFVPVRPGLVGGHCIPVDPYYLTYAAQQIGFNPDLILAGRRINDSMAEYVASATLKLLADSRGDVTGRGVLILGAAFKEDVRDARNSQVWVLARLLQENGARVLVHDPVLGREIIEAAGFDAVDDPFEAAASAAAVVLAVPHAAFRRRSLDEIIGLFEPGEGRPVLVDVYGVLRDAVAAHDHVSYWSL